jgi:hypothetical protein
MSISPYLYNSPPFYRNAPRAIKAAKYGIADNYLSGASTLGDYLQPRRNRKILLSRYARHARLDAHARVPVGRPTLPARFHIEASSSPHYRAV